MAILTVGAILFSGVVALGGLMIGGNRGLRQEIGQMRQDFSEDMKQIETRIASLEQRMFHVEGLLEGLR